MNQVAIKNERGQYLQLSPGQNLVIEQNTDWLTDTELPAEFSFPLDCPLSPENKAFVGEGYRPDSAVPVPEMPVRVEMADVLYRRCTLIYRINAGKLTGVLKIDASEFYDKIRNLSLQEALSTPIALLDGFRNNVNVSLASRLKAIAALPPGQFPLTFFPIRNEAMLESELDSTKVPGFVRSNYVNTWGKQADGSWNFFTDLNTETAVYNPIVPSAPPVTVYGRRGYLICPQLYLSYVLTSIMSLAGYRVESDWLADPEVQALTIMNLTAMRISIDQVIGGNGFIDLIEGHYVFPGYCLPDMSVGDFLKAIKGRFGLVFSYDGNSRVVKITQFSRTIRKGSAVDLTRYQAGAYSTDFKLGKGYSVLDYLDESDDLNKDVKGNLVKPDPLVIGQGGTEVSLKVGTCQLALEASPLPAAGAPGANWFVPTVKQPGNVLDPLYKVSDRFPDSTGKRKNSIGLKLLSYRGMTTDSKGNPYPLGTPDIRDGRQQIVAQQAVKLTGRYGSWRKYLRDYFYFRDQTQPVTQPLLMPVDVLSRLPKDRLVSLTLEGQVMRSYLISKIQAQQPGPDGLAPVRLEVLSLPTGLEQAPVVDPDFVYLSMTIESTRTDLASGYIRGYEYKSKITLYAWKDAAKTQPATAVKNLAVNLRRRQKNDPVIATLYLPSYKESLVTYFISGASQVIEYALQTQVLLVDHEHLPDMEDYAVELSLAPGDDYLIAS